jgi:CMP-N,N'-diacetyllegionaminic acid synthase
LSHNKYKILAIIPAREGSKRVLQKNFRPFASTTLTDITIQHGLQSKLITDIVLSSDSEEVLSIGRKYEGVISLERPEEFSTDTSPAIEFVRHTLSVLEPQKGYTYDMVVILQPSSPLRFVEDIDKTIELLANNPDADSSVSVVKIDHMVHPVKLKVLKGEELLPYIEEEKGRFAAHELPDVYVRNCAVYVTWRRDLETRPDVIGKKSLAYVMPAETSADINSMMDFEFAEYLYKKGLKGKSE